jgi:hypothetical protein
VNYTTQGLWHPYSKTLLALNFFWLAAILHSGQSNFKFEYLGEFVTEFENILGYESGAQMGLIDEKKSEVENLVPLSL